MFLTKVSKRLPSAPDGWDLAKSSGLKPLSVSKLTASASPMVNATVVLEVGAKLCGQASFSTLTSRCTLQTPPIEELALPVIPIIGTPRR